MSNLNKIRLYQYGSYVFSGDDFLQEEDVQIKSQLEDSEYHNGQIKLNKFNNDYTQDTVIDITYRPRSEDNYLAIQKLLYGKPQLVFFILEYTNQPFTGGNSGVNSNSADYKILFSYAHVIKHSKIAIRGCEKQRDIYKISIRLMNNRKYEINDNRLKFIEFSEEKKINNSWEANQGLWENNDLGNWESGYTGAVVNNWNSLTQVQKQGLIDCCKPKGFFDYSDLFFAQETYNIDTSTLNKYIEYNLTGLQASNAQLPVSTTDSVRGLNLISSASNHSAIFELQKDGTLPALGINEYVEIINNNTGSGFRLTCLNVYCPPRLSIFTHKAIKLYNSSTNGVINYLDPNTNYYLKWRIEALGQSNYFFEFSNYLPILENLQNQKTDTLLITRNFTGNYQIRIATLPTFI